MMRAHTLNVIAIGEPFLAVALAVALSVPHRHPSPFR
jgi:hypothetical protein